MSKKIRPYKVTVATSISKSRNECFAFIVPVPLQDIFTRTFFLPGVKRTDEVGKWCTPGMTRTVYFTDFTKAKETLESVNSPTDFSYTVQNFTGINKILIDHIHGEWKFVEAGETTEVNWEYSLYPKGRIAAIAIKMILPIVRRMLEKALNTTKEILEK